MSRYRFFMRIFRPYYSLTPLIFLLVNIVASAGMAAGGSSGLAVGSQNVPAEEQQLLQEYIDELFPEKPREPLPEPTVVDKSLGAVSNLGYVPLKLGTAAIYTLAGFFHCAAVVPSEGRRIIWEGWTGDWLVDGRHVSGTDPLDLVGPDREFPGHNPTARAAFVRSWYLLYSSLPYRGLPEGVVVPARDGSLEERPVLADPARDLGEKGPQ